VIFNCKPILLMNRFLPNSDHAGNKEANFIYVGSPMTRYPRVQTSLLERNVHNLIHGRHGNQLYEQWLPQHCALHHMSKCIHNMGKEEKVDTLEVNGLITHTIRKLTI